MDRKGESLAEAERQALEVLEPRLRCHAALTELAFNVIGIALSRAPELPVRDVPQSRKVATALLVRLSNDIRSAALLALRGYAVQAASLVAGIYEVAYSIAAIGSDEALAQQWIDHDDPTRPFREIRAMTQDVLAKLRVPNLEEQAANQYRVYRQLCMAKHANPLFQRQHAYQFRDGKVVAINGPDVSEPAIRAAWFALEHAARLAFVALASFVEHHILPESRGDLVKQVEAIGARSKELADAAKARWGSEDPFPGKWRT